MSDDVNYINLERLRTFLQEVKRLIPTNYATKTELNNYFPKSGGQLTGSAISRNVDNSLFKLLGGTADGQGAQISLFGKDAPYYTGQFVITAMTDANNQFNLIGTPNGSLTWNYKNIDVIEEQGDGYIRYSNGLQICWKTLHLQNLLQNVSYGFAHYFPRPFINAPSVTANYSSAYVTETVIGAEAIDNIHCNFWIKNTNSNMPDFNINYTAIGSWK